MTRILDFIYFLWYNISTSSVEILQTAWETEGELFVFLFFNKLSAQEKEQIMGNEKEYLRTQRVECAGCHMFAWGHETSQKNGKHYHGGCLESMKAVEVKQAKNKVSILHLVGWEASAPMLAGEQCAA